MDASVIFEAPFSLYMNQSEFTIQKADSQFTVIITRENNRIVSEQRQAELKGKGEEFWGVIGIGHFCASSYLIIIKKCLYIGRLKDASIFQVSEVSFKPYKSPMELQSEGLNKTDTSIIASLTNLFATNSFYFSYEFDLTLSISQQSSFQAMDTRSGWQRSDPRFFWNAGLCEDFMDVGADDAILPLINGFVQIETVQLSGNSVDFGLISRRDQRRIGTRFHMRGINKEGNAVNFVETEQLLCYWENSQYVVHSYLQVRGSIPLRWSQKPDLSLNPRARLEEADFRASKAHLLELAGKYGPTHLLNLIDRKGSQKLLGEAYETLVNQVASEKLQYTWFDFHHECRGFKYENLSKCLDALGNSLEEQQWTKGSVPEKHQLGELCAETRQQGVVRTNCMDNLDRTNVVQSVLARQLLIRQLQALDGRVQPTGEPFQELPGQMEQCFRVFWVNNANRLSNLYAGTPAQKTDFTLLGRRTLRGAMEDGRSALQRFVVNNFQDGDRQDGYDLFLRHLPPSSVTSKPSSLQRAVGALILLLVVSHFLGSIFSSGFGSGIGSYYLLWVFLVLAGLWRVLRSFGGGLVNRPLLDH